MVDHDPQTHDMPAEPLAAPQPAARRAESLRQRVERLERWVAALGDPTELEARVVARLQGTTPTALPPPTPTVAAEVAKVNHVEAVPIAKPAPTAPMATLAEFTLPVATPPPAPNLPFVANAKSILDLLPVPSLLKEIAWDFRTLAKLLLDRLYPATLAFKIVPLFAVLYVFVWPVVSPFLGWLVLVKFGPLLGVLTDGVVLYLAFKVIQRELYRYHAFAVKYHR